MSNEEIIYCARISEQTERYESMLVYVRIYVKRNQTLNAEERNLLSVAYKNIVGPLRTSWRIIDTLEQKEKAKPESAEKERNLGHIKKMKKEIEQQLYQYCMEIINILENSLIVHAQVDEDKIFYLKMSGDYYRYLAEF